MERKRNRWGLSAVMCFVGVAGFAVVRATAPPLRAQNPTDPNANVGPFDFNDSFYTDNGLIVSQLNSLGGRVGANSNGPCVQTSASGQNLSCNGGGFGATGVPNGLNWVTDTSNTDPTRTSTRLLQTTGGFNKDGNLIYYSIYSTVNDDSFFMNDANCPTNSTDPTKDFSGCGTRANTLANSFRAFIQPKQSKSGQLGFPAASCNTVDTGTFLPPSPSDIHPTIVTSQCAKDTSALANPITFGPPPGNRRQDNVFDTQPTYFCENLLGLWILVFTVYTPNAYLANGHYASAAAKAAISPIAAANGTNLDGTAVLERVSEIDSLTRQGFLEQLVMPRASHSGAPRYVV